MTHTHPALAAPAASTAARTSGRIDRGANPLSLATIARSAGILYLIIAVAGPFALLVVPSQLLVAGDGAATAANIAASGGLFRAGLAAQALLFLSETALVALLFTLFRSVSGTLALLATLSRLAMAAIQGIGLLILAAALPLANGAPYLASFEPAQLHGALTFLFELSALGGGLWGLFFGLHSLALGALLIRSGYLPRLVGVAVFVSGLAYLIDGGGVLFVAGYAAIANWVLIGMLPGTLGELVLAAWLLIRPRSFRPRGVADAAPAVAPSPA